MTDYVSGVPHATVRAVIQRYHEVITAELRRGGDFEMRGVGWFKVKGMPMQRE